MKIKEIMKREVSSLSEDMLIKDALLKLLKLKISGLPVIREDLRLVGIFTEKEILGAILPSYIDKVGRFSYEENPKIIRKKLSDIQNLKVEKLMQKELITVSEETTLCEVARIMFTQNVRRVPILDREKKVCGIVSRGDIIKRFVEELGWQID